MNILLISTVSPQEMNLGSLSGDRLTFAIGKRASAREHTIDILFNREPILDIRTVDEAGRDAGRSGHQSYDLILITIYEIGNLAKFEHLIGRGARLGLVVPAVWWLEHPDFFSISLLQLLSRFVRETCDFIICCGSLNKDYLTRFFRLMSRVDISVFTDDYYIDNLSSDASPTDEKKIIMDLGGAWRWTDLDSFLDAYRAYTSTGNRNLYLIMPGFKPVSNPDHGEYVEHVKRVCQEINPDNIRILNWDDKAGYSYWGKKAHYGLHVNKPGFEAETAHRVRFFDYLSRRIPIISTPDGRLPKLFEQVCLTVEPNDSNSYITALATIENSEDIYIRLKKGYDEIGIDEFNKTTFVDQYVELFIPKTVHESEEFFGSISHRADDAFQILESFQSKFEALPAQLRANLFNFTLSNRDLWQTFKIVPEFNLRLLEYLSYYFSQPDANNNVVRALLKTDDRFLRNLLLVAYRRKHLRRISGALRAALKGWKR